MDAPDLFTDDEDESPGWTAIEEALAALYPQQAPISFGPIIEFEHGGPDPLEATSVYRSDAGVPHWHYVTYGFSELHDKVSPDPELSGFGFELTVRLRREPEATSPPRWPLDLLQSLARYVFATGNGFDASHHMDLVGPLAPGVETAISAVALRGDPALPALESPNGRVKFLQVVGLTADELEAVRAWDPDSFLELLEAHTPLLILDPQRPSVLDAPGVREAVEARTAREGSSQETAFVGSLEWSCHDDCVRIALDATAVPNLLRLLRGRTLHGRPFLLVRGEEQVLEVTLGERLQWRTDPVEPVLTLEAPLELAEGLLETVRPQPGTYVHPTAPQLTIVVVA
jgi:hypothetical protein